MIPIVELDFSGTGNSFTQVNPKNWKQLELLGVWAFYSNSGSVTGRQPSITLRDIDLEFYGRDAQNLWDYRNEGMAGGPGITMGVPMRISDSTNPAQTLWYGVLDLGAKRVTWEPDRIVAPSKQTLSLDWFYKTIEAIDFILLRNFQIPAAYNGSKTADGKIMIGNQFLMGAPGTGALYEYKVTAYQITYDKDLISILSHMIHLIEMMMSLIDGIVTLFKQASALISDVGDLPFDILQLAGDTLVFAYDIVKVIVELGGVIGNIEVLLAQVGLISKYKYCMVVTDIIYAVLTYVNVQNGNPNLTFSSSIFGVGNNGVGYGGAYASTATQGVTIMPAKNIVMNQSAKPSINNFVNGLEHPVGDETKPGTLGPPYGCPDGNVKKFFTDICVPFNANLKIIPFGSSNDIQFEEMHYWSKPVDFTIPNTGPEGMGIISYPQPSGTNFDELSYNYGVYFRLDSKDGNTNTRYNGTTCSIAIQPKTSYNICYWLNPGGRMVEIPFALAKTKQWLSFTDDVINAIIDFVSPLYNILADITFQSHLPFNNPAISTPYPYLELTEDTTSVPKLFMGISQGAPLAFNPVGATQNPFWDSGSSGGPLPGPGSCWQPTYGDSPYPDPNQTASNNNGNPVNESYISADVLMRLFHSKNLLTPPNLVPGYNGGNQWQIYEKKQFKMVVSDFINILQNGNVVKWVDGNTACYLEELTWRCYDDMAINVKYRINQPYTTNYQQPTVVIDGTNI